MYDLHNILGESCITKCAEFFNLHELAEINQFLSMADEPVAVANTLASPLGPDRVGQVWARTSEHQIFCCLKSNILEKCSYFIPDQVREVGGRATWSLSSCKPGFGVEQLRDDRCLAL